MIRGCSTVDDESKILCVKNMHGMSKEKSSEFNASGILYKWVNFGKGWRPRWFSLKDGVLSYYKIHGQNKIHVIPQGERIIGEESHKLVKKQSKYCLSDEKTHPKCYGEVHIKGFLQRVIKGFLKGKHASLHTKNGGQRNFSKWGSKVVCERLIPWPSAMPILLLESLRLELTSTPQISSFKASKSDERKFYIFTGIKTLHLRAETTEDRRTWMDALQATKESFPRSWADSVVLPESQEIAISLKALRKRLQEEGLSEEVIGDCEDIMNSEFSVLQQQLRLLQQKNIYLIEKLRQLRAENMELETKVVDERENHFSGESVPEDCHGSDLDTDEEKETQSEVGADTDDEDDVFFDTKEFIGADTLTGQSSFKLLREFSCAESPLSRSGRHVDGDNICMNVVDSSYSLIERRKRLPEPKEIEKSVSLWSLIKDNIGKDLTKVCLPVYFNEPISFLQKSFEDMEYSYLLDQAYEYGKHGNHLMRILHVAAFAVSGYASSEGRTCKPFNPLLGETYEADYPDKGLRFVSEKVSHHPMTIACHCEGRGWSFWGDSTLKSRFWGRSIQLDPVGILSLKFEDGEVFQWSKVTTSIYNLILGKLYSEHYGTMRIQGNRLLSCKLKFKEQSIIERNPRQVQGYVHDGNGNKLATLIGKWDENMYFVMGDIVEKSRSYDPMSEAVLLWMKNAPPEYPTRYNLTSFAITLNELTPGLKEKLPPTDSRLRPDQRHLECGEYDLANAEKLRLEQKQRQAYKQQEKGWQPRWFKRENEQSTYRYLGGYWEARENACWEGCPDIFGSSVPETSPE